MIYEVVEREKLVIVAAVIHAAARPRVEATSLVLFCNLKDGNYD